MAAASVTNWTASWCARGVGATEVAWHDAVGLVGVTLIVIAYGLLQTESVRSRSLTYLLLNLGGASLVLVSLTQQWNLPSVVVESFWVLISVYGLACRRRERRVVEVSDPATHAPQKSAEGDTRSPDP